MADAHHSIKLVARHTGLSAHVIRIWEKRYGAVEPERTGTNRRLYSTDQVERLILLRDLTRAGHSIGNVAKLPTAKLRSLAAEAPSKNGAAPKPSTSASPDGFLEDCVAAVKSLDSKALDGALNRALISLGWQGVLQRVVGPLAHTLGLLWRDGTITAAHEHFATAVIRIFLGHASKPVGQLDDPPGLVVATPAGQVHELGALIVAALAANLGWHVTYLGANLPAAEIAGAARHPGVRAVALSLVYPEDDARLEGELIRLRELLPAELVLLVGGRAMPAYRAGLKKLRALPVETLDQLCEALDQLRKPPETAKR